MLDNSGVWCLLRESDGKESGSSRVIAVYETRDDLEDRVCRIAKANAMYPLRQLTSTSWRIGPDEDQGFFGHKAVYLYAVKSAFHPAKDSNNV